MLISDRKGRWTSYRLNEKYEKDGEQYEISDIEIVKKMFRNKSDRIIYEYIQANGFITVHQVLDSTSITTKSGANAALGRLLKAGFIKKQRQGRQFIYRLK